MDSWLMFDRQRFFILTNKWSDTSMLRSSILRSLTICWSQHIHLWLFASLDISSRTEETIGESFPSTACEKWSWPSHMDHPTRTITLSSNHRREFPFNGTREVVMTIPHGPSHFHLIIGESFPSMAHESFESIRWMSCRQRSIEKGRYGIIQSRSDEWSILPPLYQTSSELYTDNMQKWK